MTELVQISVTAAFTILGGVVILVLSKWYQRRYVDLFEELDDIRADITVTIVFNANIYGNPATWSSTKMNNAQDELRMMSARLRAAQLKIDRTPLFDYLYVVKNKGIDHGASKLMGLSNTIITIDHTQIQKMVDEIRKHLKVHV